MAIIGLANAANIPVTAAPEKTREQTSRAATGATSLPSQLRRRRVGLPVEAQAAVTARHLVQLMCVLFSASEVYDDAAACVTELVSNAVKHARWPDDPARRTVWLTVTMTGPYLMVEVSDPDPVLPVVATAVDWDRFDWSGAVDDGCGESGFGLFTVVERVRETGGYFTAVPTATGKTVLFALPLGNWRQRLGPGSTVVDQAQRPQTDRSSRSARGRYPP
jgi:hypothetical protein